MRAITSLIGVMAAVACTPLFGGAPGAAPSRKPATVTYWGMHSLAAIPRTAELFAAVADRVRGTQAITLQAERPGGELRDKLVTSFAAGDPPDAFGVNSGWTMDSYDKGYCLALDRYIARTREAQDQQFLQGSLYYTKRDGKTFALPADGPAAYNLTYNVNHLRAAGIDPSQAAVRNWMWEDLVKIAQKLHQPTAATPQYALWSPFGFWQFVTWLYTNGGTFWKGDVEGSEPTFNSERGLQALQFNADLRNAHRVLVPPDVTFTPRPWNGLLSGQISIYHGDFSHWAETARQRDFAWDVAPLPKGPQGKRPASQAWYHVDAVAAQSKVPDAAFAFVAFDNGKEGASLWLEYTNRTHPRKDSYESAVWKKIVAEVPANERIPYLASISGPSPAWNTGVVSQAVNKSLVAAFSGTMGARDALRDAEQQLRGAMQTLKK
ncbi:MAG: extracellular solute-binding protein [Chloroflexi bacterium]|nr:extracellular solute-binding protein [Chloroflexota bacterium]